MRKQNKFLKFLLFTTAFSITACLAGSINSQSQNSNSIEIKSNNDKISLTIPATTIGGDSGTVTIEYTNPSDCAIISTKDFKRKGDFNFNGGHFTYDNINFTITSIGASAFKNNGPRDFYETNLTIPSTIKYIDDYAFANHNCSYYQEFFSINFEEGVECIGKEAFANCHGYHNPKSHDPLLESIKLPNSIKKIGVRAFKNTQIKYLDLTSLNHVIFTQVDIFDKDYYIFDNKYLTSITFANKWIQEKYWKNSHWYKCSYLFKSNDDTNPILKFNIPATLLGAKSGFIYAKSDSRNNECVITGCSKDFFAEGRFDFNDGILNFGNEIFKFVEIDEGAFKQTDMNINYFKHLSLRIPSTIRVIREEAFYVNYWLRNKNTIDFLKIDEGVKAIEESAFENLVISKIWDQKSIIFPNSIISIGNKAFKNTNMIRADLTNLDHVINVESTPADKDLGCFGQLFSQNTYISLNKDMFDDYLDVETWYSCKKDISIDYDFAIDKSLYLTYIDEYGKSSIITSNDVDFEKLCNDSDYIWIPFLALSIPKNKITSIRLNGYKNITKLPDHFLSNLPNLKSIDLRRMIEINEIGDFVFSSDESLTEVILPCSISSIGNSFMRECHSVKQMVIRCKYLTKIGDMFMAGCKNLEQVDLSKALSYFPYKEGIFGWNPNLWSILVNEKNANQYKNDLDWNEFKDMIHGKIN